MVALTAQADLERLVQRVFWPLMRELQPRSVVLSDHPVDEETFFKVAKDMTHNALGQEARKAFAITLGAMFERQLRLWLAQSAPERAKTIQKAQREELQALVLELKGVDMAALKVSADLHELWELVSALRHGDGRATERLRKLAPHLVSETETVSDIRFSTVNITDADLMKYHAATVVFWSKVGASTPIWYRE